MKKTLVTTLIASGIALATLSGARQRSSGGLLQRHQRNV